MNDAHYDVTKPYFTSKLKLWRFLIICSLLGVSQREVLSLATLSFFLVSLLFSLNVCVFVCSLSEVINVDYPQFILNLLDGQILNKMTSK